MSLARKSHCRKMAKKREVTGGVYPVTPGKTGQTRQPENGQISRTVKSQTAKDNNGTGEPPVRAGTKKKVKKVLMRE